MSANIRLPQINGKSDREQLAQVRSFLYQLVGELNYALENVQGGGAAGGVAYMGSAGAGGAAEDQQTAPKATFNSIKSLIIKSADIINAYYDVISKKLEGLYVAQSAFGTYTEETAVTLKANSSKIEQLFTNIQTVISDVEGVANTLIEVSANINTGILFYDEDGVPVYGLEIGQRTEIDGVEVFNKFARFTADKLSFYDNNGKEVAYISDKRLYITHVEIQGSMKMGGFTDTKLTDGSIVTKWTGV